MEKTMKRFDGSAYCVGGFISSSVRRLVLICSLTAFAYGQGAPEVTTNIQVENLVFYMDQHGDATKIGTLPGPAPTDPQLGLPLRRYAIIADVVSFGGRPAAGTFLAHGIVVAPSNAPQP